MAPGWARSNSRRPRLRLCRDHRAALLAKRPCLDSRTVPSPESKAILARRSSGSFSGHSRSVLSKQGPLVVEQSPCPSGTSPQGATSCCTTFRIRDVGQQDQAWPDRHPGEIDGGDEFVGTIKLFTQRCDHLDAGPQAPRGADLTGVRVEQRINVSPRLTDLGSQQRKLQSDDLLQPIDVHEHIFSDATRGVGRDRKCTKGSGCVSDLVERASTVARGQAIRATRRQLLCRRRR